MRTVVCVERDVSSYLPFVCYLGCSVLVLPSEMLDTSLFGSLILSSRRKMTLIKKASNDGIQENIPERERERDIGFIKFRC